MKENTTVETTPRSGNVNTHTYIQQVQRHKGITQSVKTVLVHCLTKYQARDTNGNPYTFSIGRIQYDTGLGNGTVKRAVTELRHHKVMKVCGQIRFNPNQDKPTTLHLFSLDALKTYLEVKSKVETSLSLNKDNAETTIEASQNHEVKSIVKSIVKSTVAHIEEDSSKKIVKEEEDNNNYRINSEPNGINNLKEMENEFYRKSVSDVSTPSASVSVGDISTTVPPSASPCQVSMVAASVPNVSTTASASPSAPKVSMDGSVVRYNPPKTFDQAKLKAYDKGLQDNPPKVIQFKRNKYPREQEERDQKAIASGSKMFPKSIIELYD